MIILLHFFNFEYLIEVICKLPHNKEEVSLEIISIQLSPLFKFIIIITNK